MNDGNRLFETLIHVTCLGLILGFPFLFILDQEGNPVDWSEYIKRCVVIAAYCIVFYINYFLLMPDLLFKERQKRFLAVNALMVTVFCVCIQFWQKHVFPELPPPPVHRPKINPSILFFARDAFIMILTISLAAAIRLDREMGKGRKRKKGRGKEQDGSRAEEPAEPDQPAFPAQHPEQHLRPHSIRLGKGPGRGQGTEPAPQICPV